jgi:hypothetical protein
MMDAAFDCFDETVLHSLTADAQRQMKQKAIEILRGKVMDRIVVVASPRKGLHAPRISRSQSAGNTSAGGSADMSSSVGEDGTEPSRTPTPWAVRLEELVASHEKRNWEEFATVKLTVLRFPAPKKRENRNRSFLRTELKSAVDGSFGRLLGGISQCKSIDEMKAKFAANIDEFRETLVSNLQTAVNAHWHKKLKTAYSNLSEVTRKKNAMMRTCYDDFMKSVASSINPKQYTEAGKHFMVGFVNAFQNCDLIRAPLSYTQPGGDGKIKRPP